MQAQDDGRVAHVNLFVDAAADPVATGLVEPFQFSVPTTRLTPGIHSLRASSPTRGQHHQVSGSFEVTTDTTPPQIALVNAGHCFRIGPPIAFVVTPPMTWRSRALRIAWTRKACRAPPVSAVHARFDGGGPWSPHRHRRGHRLLRHIATLPVAFEITLLSEPNAAPSGGEYKLSPSGPLTNFMIVLSGANGAVEALARVT